MKKIIAIVKPFLAQKVLEAIQDCEIHLVRVSEVRGYGKQKDSLPMIGAAAYGPVYLPKIEICILTADSWSATIVQRIEQIARTGRIGDGKIFVLPVLAEFDF